MSRSTKAAYYTDQSTAKPGRVARAKRTAARAVRDTSDVANGAAYKKLSCSWNIRDWSFYAPRDPKAKRK